MATPAKKDRAGIASVVKWVRVSDLVIGAKYQRTIREHKVAAIADNFDPFQFGVPAASQRADGSLHVTDGQHRVMAMRRMGWDDQMIQVEIIPELTYAEEAGTHVDRNANRTATSAIDQFFGNVEANRKMQKDILGMVESRGLVIMKQSNKQPNAVWAVSTLEKLYTDGGKTLLGKTLDTILAAWGPSSDAFQANILKAVSRLHLEYDRLLDDGKLAKSLKRYRPAEYLRRAEAGKELNRSNTILNMVVAIVADYNSVAGGRKLPPATDLVNRAGVPNARRITVAQRAQITELLLNGYSKAEVKERYEKVSKAQIDRIYKDLRGQRKFKTKRKKAS